MNLKTMAKYILGKAMKLVSLLTAVSILSFILISFSPVDPVQSYIGADMNRVSSEQRENIARYWGLDQSKPQQFINWGRSVLQGDFGSSLLYRSPVINVIGERFIASLALMTIA